jgi:hypothetical protein
MSAIGRFEALARKGKRMLEPLYGLSMLLLLDGGQRPGDRLTSDDWYQSEFDSAASELEFQRELDIALASASRAAALG